MTNIVSLIVMMMPKMRKSSFAVYLAALAISDGGNLILHSIFWINYISALSGRPLVIVVFGGFAKSFMKYISMYFAALSSWLVTLISIERFIVVCFPMSASRSPLIIGTTVGIWFYDECNKVVIKSIRGASDPIRRYFLTEIFTWIDHFASPLYKEILPALLLIIFNSHLIWTLRKISSRRKEMTHEGEQRLDVKAIRIAVAIVILFIVCEIPASFRSYNDFIGRFFKMPPIKYSTTIYMLQVLFTDLLPTLNSSVNFFIYYLANDNFRETAIKLLRRRPI
ncbi:uncharacterized protein LOC141911253 [Tubulanus polymorphus]|uniref:uncharacterized protein LOC141911253 n=1 Tax=Tubulanus polymorphus TaxID=672921 RepID=UPI003DA553F7